MVGRAVMLLAVFCVWRRRRLLQNINRFGAAIQKKNHEAYLDTVERVKGKICGYHIDRSSSMFEYTFVVVLRVFLSRVV